MTIDTSLKVKVGGNKTRNVLTRAERVNKLKENQRWEEGNPVYGMPKVRVEKISLKKKKKVKGPEDAATPGAAAASPAAGAAKSSKK
jgi:small basic protein (TIGR04137 family)